MGPLKSSFKESKAELWSLEINQNVQDHGTIHGCTWPFLICFSLFEHHDTKAFTRPWANINIFRRILILHVWLQSECTHGLHNRLHWHNSAHQCGRHLVPVRRYNEYSVDDPRILSAISTGLGPSLSPPVFGYHGDDVTLHHRVRPVDGLSEAVQTNPRTIDRRNLLPVSLLLAPCAICSTVLVAIFPQCVKLCICKLVSAETRSGLRYDSDFLFLFFFALSFWWDLRRTMISCRNFLEHPPAPQMCGFHS